MLCMFFFSENPLRRFYVIIRLSHTQYRRVNNINNVQYLPLRTKIPTIIIISYRRDNDGTSDTRPSSGRLLIIIMWRSHWIRARSEPLSLWEGSHELLLQLILLYEYRTSLRVLVCMMYGNDYFNKVITIAIDSNYSCGIRYNHILRGGT